jgi:tetratricopeptide (TPR) repeat protein
MKVVSREADIAAIFDKGLQAHNAGDLSAAEQLYQETLAINPEHPEANHNIGVVLVAKNELDKALAFFKFALDNSPNVSLFWASYIDTLIKLERIGESKILVKAVKQAGISCDKIEALSQHLDVEHQDQWGLNTVYDQQQLDKPKTKKVYKTDNILQNYSTTIVVQNFYKKMKKNIIAEAALGWFFTSSFDASFLREPLPSNSNKQGRIKTAKKIISINTESSVSKMDANQTLDYLRQHQNISNKFNELKLLINSSNFNLTNDSFCQDLDANILAAQKQTFNHYGFNVVIIGAGATGLFLASILKSVLGGQANILVLDNRSNEKNTREIFSRNWLTHIPSLVLQRFTPPNVQELFTCFGKDGMIGLPINALESILMLSCKNQGVKFYFSPDLDLKQLDDPSINCFFDATAGQIIGSSYNSADHPNVTMQYSKRNLKFNGSGIKQLHNLPSSEDNYTEIMLKYSEPFHYPFLKNSKIYTNMFKLTGIPMSIIQKVHTFIEPLNALNRFFVWEGALNNEINEGLMLINLTIKETQILKSRVQIPRKLNSFLQSDANILPFLNKDIISALRVLGELDIGNKIYLERPFAYFPHINLEAHTGRFNGKPIFPIGDSLFSGNPKVGNGLGSHLSFLNDLVAEVIASRQPKS